MFVSRTREQLIYLDTKENLPIARLHPEGTPRLKQSMREPMALRLAGAGLLGAAALACIPASAEEAWAPLGTNNESISSAWALLSTYKPHFNEYSFRVYARLYSDKPEEGRLDVNCNAKDYFFDRKDHLIQISRWKPIATGSAIETVAKYFCRRTAAKASWGFTSETAYLWDAPAPSSSQGTLSGEWIKAYSNDGSEVFYHSSAIREARHVQAAIVSPDGKASGKSEGIAPRGALSWINVSCENSLFSSFLKPSQVTPGIWERPIPAIPGTVAFVVKQAYCR